MKHTPWEVWFYAPSGGRKLIDRFNTRNEAESHRAILGRLIGKPSLLTVCFDPVEAEPPNF
jgi:hypothetical protein